MNIFELLQNTEEPLGLLRSLGKKKAPQGVFDGLLSGVRQKPKLPVNMPKTQPQAQAPSGGQPRPTQAAAPGGQAPSMKVPQPKLRPPVLKRQESDVSGGGEPPRNQPKPSGRKPTDFDKTLDREFAKDITEWTLGGQQTAYSNLKALGELINDLENPNKNLTGPLVGNLPYRSLTAPESRDAEDRAGRVIQQGLKAVLGAQFAEREAQQLIERSYNRRLDEPYNVERLKSTYNDILRRAQMNDRAAKYLNEYGTLDGFDGTLDEFSEMGFYGLGNNSLRDVMGSAQEAAEAHGWSEGGGLSDDEEARYQELLRKQASGTLQ